MKKPFRLSGLVVRHVIPALLAFPVLAGSLAHAQSKPLVAYILPSGGQRGTAVEVGIHGRYLTGATEVYISGQGATGKVVSVE